MTPPPPSEPIRPVGPLAGGIYVDRAELADRITRRRPRRDQDRDGAGSNEQHGQHADEEPGQHRLSTTIRDPRAYDDHGRRPEDDDADSERPHVDATA